MRLISFVATMALVNSAVLNVPTDDSSYNFDGVNDERTPTYNVTIITADQAYNTNQNVMNLTYYSTWSAEK